MKDVKLKLAIDEPVTPFAQKHHVPFYLCERVDNTLKTFF